MEIGDLAKNLSVCAKSFGQSIKTKTEIVGNQINGISEICAEDDAAKDCL